MDMPIFFKSRIEEEVEPEHFKYSYQVNTEQIPADQTSEIHYDEDLDKYYIRIPDIRLLPGFQSDPDFLGYDYGDTFGRNQNAGQSDWKKMMRVHVTDGEGFHNLLYYDWEPIKDTLPEPDKYVYPVAYLGEIIEPPADVPVIAATEEYSEDWFFGVIPTGRYYRIARRNILRELVQVISSEGMVDVIRVNTSTMEDPPAAAEDPRFLGRTYYDTYGRGISGYTEDPNSWKWTLGVRYDDNGQIVTARYDYWEVMDPKPDPIRFVYYVEDTTT